MPEPANAPDAGPPSGGTGTGPDSGTEPGSGGKTGGRTGGRTGGKAASGAGTEPGTGTGSGTGTDCGEAAPIDRVSGDEPLLAARVHRPSDLLRLLIGLLAIALVLAVAAFAHGTTSGLAEDINHGTGQTPDMLIKLAGLFSSIAILILPVAFAIERLVKRDGLRIADGVLAAVLAHGVALATDLWVAKAAPKSITVALTHSLSDGSLTDPVHGYLAPVIAYMTAVGMARRPRWRVALWVVLLVNAFAVLVGGQTTPSRSSSRSCSAGPWRTARCTPSARPTSAPPAASSSPDCGTSASPPRPPCAPRTSPTPPTRATGAAATS